MKKIILFLTSAIVVFSMVSCSRSLPDRITKLADQVEAKGANYSTKEWEKTASDFEALLLEFADNYDSYKPSEKSEVYKAVGKFTKAAIKGGAGNVAATINGILNDAGKQTNSLLDEAKGLLEGLGL